jgi:hypothetical protein
MMPKKDWEMITDDWGEHDLAKGGQHGDRYPGILADRYGAFRNLADFVRKAQLANYEAFRAMYEGRNAQLFHPTTAVITWMSHPAQPSFVWQIYHYDMEPMSSFFAVMHASELVHIQFNEANGELQVINNLPQAVADAVAHVSVYNLDGTLAYQHETKVTAQSDVATNLGAIQFPAAVSPIHFIKLELHDAMGKLISNNFYWRSVPEHPDDFSDLSKLTLVTLEVKVVTKDAEGKRMLTVTLHNPSTEIALMVHLQLRRRKSGERVLPVFYSDNYVSLVPNETRTVTIEADANDFNGDDALVMFDGWNVAVKPATFKGAAVAPNVDAQPDRSPATGLPFQVSGLR